jgi:hypothetical protein
MPEIANFLLYQENPKMQEVFTEIWQIFLEILH